MEKSFFHDLDIPTPAYAVVDSLAALQGHVRHRLSCHLKSRAWVMTVKVNPAQVGRRLSCRLGVTARRGLHRRRLCAVSSGSLHYRGRRVRIRRHRVLSVMSNLQPAQRRFSDSRCHDPLQPRRKCTYLRLMEELDYVGVMALELSMSMANCWPMSMRHAYTTPAIGRLKARKSASSKIICGPFWICP